MFDYSSTQIERMAAAHQRQIDDEAAEQDLQEAEEQAISRDPETVARAMEYFEPSEWYAMERLIGKLVSQYQYHGEERDQGILDTAQEICDLCQRVIAEQATYNRHRAMRSES